MNRLSRATWLALALAFPAAASAQGNVIVHSNPWSGGDDLETAATAVFGAGNFSVLGYPGLNAATLFSAANSFVFLEGGDGTGGAFKSFVESNGAAMLSWVQNGGGLVLSAATWSESINTVFGIDIVYGSFGNQAIADDPSHDFFDQGWTTQTSWNGSNANHNKLVGAGLEGLMYNEFNDMVLGGMSVGSGYVLFSGMTTGLDWSEYPAGNGWTGWPELEMNMMDWAASGGMGDVGAVPEPISMVLLGTGLAGVGAARRRRRNAGQD